MQVMSRHQGAQHHHHTHASQTKEQREARERMALFPHNGVTAAGEGSVEVLFVKSDIWVVSTHFPTAS
jgi:hypothetical protein